MRTDFSITARQIKEIFPESWLKSERLVFRGVQKEDVTQLCKVDPSCSDYAFLTSLEEDSETIFIVAEWKEKILGYIRIAELDDLVLYRVFVRKDGEKHGIATCFLVVFYCFALFRNAATVRAFSPDGDITNKMRRIGVSQNSKTCYMSDIAKSLKKHGVDLSKYRA